MSKFESAKNWWNEFWFASKDLIGLSLMRFQICSVMLYLYTIRLFNNMDMLSEKSMVPREYAKAIMPDFYRPYFSWTFWPDSMATNVHTLFVILLLFLTLGVGGRWIAWLAWVIHLGFIQRNYSIIFGADLISCLFLFYLAFTKSDAHISVIDLFRKRKTRPIVTNDLLSSVMYRMIQVHISIIYAYTGFEKLKGASWWDGTALWTVWGNQQMTLFDMSFLRAMPMVIAIITFTTIVFEIYWPVMIALKKWRQVWLLLGFLFHAGIAVTMGLTTFSLIMTSTYYLFLDPQVLHKILDKIKSYIPLQIG